MTSDSAAIELALIHRIIRRQFAEVARLVRAVDCVDRGHLDAAVERVRVASASWTVAPSAATAASLAERIGTSLVVLESQLDKEESEVVPLIVQHLSDAECQQVGQQGFEEFTPAQRWIATDQLVEVASPRRLR